MPALVRKWGCVCTPSGTESILDHVSVAHIVKALGSFDDVADDPWLAEAAPEASFTTVSSYWHQRQPELAAWLATAFD